MTQTQLDPQARSLLEAMKASGLPQVFTLPVADARRARRRQLVVDPPRVEMAKVEDDLVPGPLGGIPLRWYRPSPEGGLPVTLFFHGGGWTVDDLDTHDHLCLASRSQAVVVSVAYRRGPEHPYPAAVEDAYAAAGWVAAVGRERGVDPTRLAVAGDSAGGNLATVVALLCRDRRGPAVRFQALAYPVTDHWQAGRAPMPGTRRATPSPGSSSSGRSSSTCQTAWIAPTPTSTRCAPPISAVCRRR
jgi:acetyl esterase